MNNKNNESALKLVGNKVFVWLLALAIVIILFVSFRNNKPQKSASTNIDEEVNEILNNDNTPVQEVTLEIVETFLPVDEETPKEEVAEKIIYKMPLNGEVQKIFSNGELMWDETMQDWRTHTGIDIASKEGDEVDTAGPGTVTQAEEDARYGFVVTVDHGDGVTTVYKNLAKIVVAKGDTLDEGQMIGTVGGSAPFEMAQNPHLHFEVITEDGNVNPVDFILN